MTRFLTEGNSSDFYGIYSLYQLEDQYLLEPDTHDILQIKSNYIYHTLLV